LISAAWGAIVARGGAGEGVATAKRRSDKVAALDPATR